MQDMQDTQELKQHPDYWKLHKQLWEEEFSNLDNDIAQQVMADPEGGEATQLQKKVIVKVRDSLLHKKI